MINVARTCLVLLGIAACSQAQAPVKFVDELYPLLEKAGCHRCHNPDGVASGTRLHFPEEGASRERVEAFGEWLVELVNRKSPGQSILLNKPTNRVKHSGGERIQKGSREEVLLTRWIGRLAALPEQRVKQALLYKKSESRSYGQTEQVY